MQPTLCSRCKKNVAVVFISRMNEKNEMVNEGLCLKCAAQLGLPQVEEMMKRMGITPEDLENINSEMMQAFGGAEEMSDLPEDGGEDDEESGKTATFPFLNRLFSNSSNPPAEQPRDNAGAGQQQPVGRKKDQKRKFLDNYCINLSQRARDGKLDAVIGREQEIERVGQILNQYRKHIEKDTALERRFQPVTVNEPNIEDTLKILQGIAHYYEQFHGVAIPQGVLRQAVLLSERYITDRYLPDKAIDLIDEACSDKNLHDPDINRRMELERELENLTFERENLMSAQPADGQEFTQDELDRRYERIAELRSQELRVTDELNAIRAKGTPQLTMDNIARVIEMWTKIPASKIKEEEFKRLAELDQRLRAHVVGQDEAIAAVSAAIRRNRVGISPKHKPVSFIFVGPTGVGKTELVKQLADDLFNAPESLIRLDMSEFMEKHSVSRIVGSPPGYVGYDEAGQLTEKIRRKPYSVVLFDEIEKAHPDVLNVLLQILDDGQITDAHGRKVNFENTIIVMTSNAGSDTKSAGAVGFGGSADDQGKERTMKALRDFLRPEFLNRVDEIICFNHLSKENFAGIARIMLEELRKSLSDKGYTFHYDDALVDYLVEKSYSMTYGARNLRRLIQKELEDPMAARIIDSFENPITQISATAADGAVQLYTL